MFRAIKLYFTDRNYYYQRKRYVRLQREYRKKLKKLTKEFCPWSGYYMHEMIKTMLEFYEKTYSAGDCCWSEECRVRQRAKSLKEVLDYAGKLELIDEAELADLVREAEVFSDFKPFCDKIAKSFYGTETEKLSADILGYTAYEFLEKKYTSLMYGLIGEHIWDWND